MSKAKPEEKIQIWKEIFSPTIFKLDIVDGFKYRKKQTWFSLFVILALFCLGIYFLPINTFALNQSAIWLSLLYIPLLFAILFWFRACSIYDFSTWEIHVEKKPITKKQSRASLISKFSLAIIALYYFFWMYKLFTNR